VASCSANHACRLDTAIGSVSAVASLPGNRGVVDRDNRGKIALDGVADDHLDLRVRFTAD
jgi:hypothetical protein